MNIGYCIVLSYYKDGKPINQAYSLKGQTRSIALNKSVKEIHQMKESRSIIFKEECLFIPIVTNWRNKKGTLIAVLVLSNIEESTFKNKGSKISNLISSTFFRDFQIYSRLFFNSLILDLKQRKRKIDFNSLVQISKY